MPARQCALSGWVHRVRDHGGLLFIDLRDHYGLTQCVVDPHAPAFAAGEKVRAEWVIRVDGEVVIREGDTVNPHLPTGEVEVRIGSIEVLSKADELPLPVFGEPEYPEEIRLKYRFLDLRRETIHRNIMKRSAIVSSIRRRMTDEGFFEFQTPILTASSPEGARDFLVPSRMHPGKFYALPQAPQQFKQLIMIAGFDRYFQIAPCFRDEDARADRSPGEFYQLDIEMSFVTQEDVFQAVEPVLRGLFEEFGEGKPVTAKFPRIPYDEAIAKYGTDKPDLRNPLLMQDVSEHFRGSGFKVFAGMLEKDPKARVWAIPAPGGGSSRLLRPHELLGAEPRATGPRLHLFPRPEWRGQGDGKGDASGGSYLEGGGPVAKNLGPDRTDKLGRQLALKGGRCRLLRGRRPGEVLQIRGRGAHQGRPRAEPHGQGPLRILLDHRLPLLRMERGREEDRLLAQSVLHAARAGWKHLKRPRRRVTRRCSG